MSQAPDYAITNSASWVSWAYVGLVPEDTEEAVHWYEAQLWRRRQELAALLGESYSIAQFFVENELERLQKELILARRASRTPAECPQATPLPTAYRPLRRWSRPLPASTDPAEECSAAS